MTDDIDNDGTTLHESGGVVQPTDAQIGALKSKFGVTSDGRGIREFTQVKEFALAVLALAVPQAPLQAEPDPFREHLAQQAENIDQDGLRSALTWMGSACAGDGQEGFAARIGENVNRLIRSVADHKRNTETSLQAEPVPVVASEPDGEVISANYECAVVKWAKPSDDPDNAWSWPIAGTKVYLSAPLASESEPVAAEQALRKCLEVLDRVYIEVLAEDCMPAAGLIDARKMARTVLATPHAEPAVAEQAQDELLNIAHCELEKADRTIAALRAALASQSTPPPESAGQRLSDGIEKAAKWVDDRREQFEREHGMIDPDTGFMEFRQIAQHDYDYELVEIAEGIRAILAANPTAQPDGGSKA